MGNDYSEIIDAMVWSYSRISTFAQCKYSFYLKYIVDDESEYLPEGNYWAEVGSFMHEILEKIFKNELSPDDAITFFVDNFDNRVLYKTSQSTMDNTYDACINYLSSEDFWWVKECEILGVEQEVSISIFDYKFTGYIDLVLQNKHTGDIILVDHKSAAYPLSANGQRVLKNHAKSFESYTKQMYLYSNAIRQLYGKFPKYIVWNHFKAGRMVKIAFDPEEYDASIKWFIDTIESIKNERDYQENVDYFYCHNLCAFRNSCEYNQYPNKSE